MWEEKGTDEIDGEGHETWDKSWTTNNEVSLWYLNNDRKPGVTNILNDMMCANPSNKPTPTPTKGWTKHSGDNCWGGHGATDMENPPRSSCGSFDTVAECEAKCTSLSGCTGITVQNSGGKFDCYRKKDVNIGSCDHGTSFTTYTYAPSTEQFLQ
jgi:hypothetical protein